MQLNTANKLCPLEHPATLQCSEERTEKIESPQLRLPKIAFYFVIYALMHLAALNV